jgi:hypothetical protein
MGEGIAAACASSGVGRSTVERLRARGRQPGADAEAAEFAGRWDAIPREGRSAVPEDAEPLTDEQLVGVVESSARRGSAEAARMLLARRGREAPAAAEEQEYPSWHPFSWTTPDDPFLAGEPESMALLTEEERALVSEFAAPDFASYLEAREERGEDPFAAPEVGPGGEDLCSLAKPNWDQVFAEHEAAREAEAGDPWPAEESS